MMFQKNISGSIDDANEVIQMLELNGLQDL